MSFQIVDCLYLLYFSVLYFFHKMGSYYTFKKKKRTGVQPLLEMIPALLPRSFLI